MRSQRHLLERDGVDSAGDRDKPLMVNTVLPAITGGTLVVGQTLISSTGTWTNSPTSYTRQWQRDGVDIPGAVNTNYTLTTDDIGDAITVVVTARKATFDDAVAVSLATIPVSAAPLFPPVNTGLPAITGGTATEGQTLVSSTGTWTGSPSGYARRWLRNGVPISLATGTNYTLATADVGAIVSVEVTATNGDGSTVAVSLPTAVIAAIPLVNTALPAISGGTATQGQTLSISDGTWTGSPTSYNRQWQRNGVDISGANFPTYTLVLADVGTVVRCVVTANKAGTASVSANSLPTATVAASGGALPANTVLPTIGSTQPIVGVALTGADGTWTGSPTFTYQWRADGVNIAGATSASYTPVAADIGKVLNLRVRGTNASGSADAVTVNAAKTLYNFELLSAEGSSTITLTDTRNIRLRLGSTGTTWLSIADAGTFLSVTLAVARSPDGKGIDITGFPGGAAPAGTLMHYEQKLPPEANTTNASAVTPVQIVAAKVGGPVPVVSSVKGIGIACTKWDTPVGEI